MKQSNATIQLSKQTTLLSNNDDQYSNNVKSDRVQSLHANSSMVDTISSTTTIIKDNNYPSISESVLMQRSQSLGPATTIPNKNSPIKTKRVLSSNSSVLWTSSRLTADDNNVLNDILATKTFGSSYEDDDDDDNDANDNDDYESIILHQSQQRQQSRSSSIVDDNSDLDVEYVIQYNDGKTKTKSNLASASGSTQQQQQQQLRHNDTETWTTITQEVLFIILSW
jgi:hypothetical protein